MYTTSTCVHDSLLIQNSRTHAKILLSTLLTGPTTTNRFMHGQKWFISWLVPWVWCMEHKGQKNSTKGWVPIAQAALSCLPPSAQQILVSDEFNSISSAQVRPHDD
jgi:hypothetical protein